MYNARSKVDPFYNQLLVGGWEKNQPFLGYVDMYGSSYVDKFAATGFGMHLAMPILRNAWKPDLTEQEARAALEDCMRVLYYRDGYTINRFNLAKIDPSGVTISEPYSLSTNWNYQRFVNPGLRAL
jgi:20S proteasome subunit beta 7